MSKICNECGKEWESYEDTCPQCGFYSDFRYTEDEEFNNEEQNEQKIIHQ